MVPKLRPALSHILLYFTGLFAPKFPRDETLFRLFAEVLTGNAVSNLAQVIGNFCQLPKDPTLPVRITLTYNATHEAALDVLGSWRLVTS